MRKARKGLRRRIVAGLSVIAVLTVAASVILFLCTGRYVERERRQISNAVLRQSLQAVDGALASLDRLTTEFMLSNNFLNQFLMAGSIPGAQQYRMKQSFDRFYDALYHRYGEAVSLYIHAPLTGRLYLNGAMYSYESFGNPQWVGRALGLANSGEWSLAAGEEVYLGYQRFAVRPALYNKRTYPLSTARSFGLVETLMDTAYFQELLAESLPTPNSQFYVFSSEGEALFWAGDGCAEYVEETWEAQDAPAPLGLRLGPTVYAMESGYTGWRYCIRIPVSGLFSLFSPIGMLYALLVAVYLAGVSVYLVMLFLRPYRTVVKLVEKLRVSMDQRDGPPQADEFLTLQTCFQQLSGQIKGLQEQVEAYRPAMCRQLILDLTQPGRVPSLQEHARKLAMAGLPIHTAGFCAALLRRPGGPPLEEGEAARRLAAQPEASVRPLCAKLGEDLLLLLTTNQPLTAAQARDAVQACIKALDGGWAAGMGPVCAASGIAESLRKAQEALEYSLRLDECRVVEYSEAMPGGIADAALLQVRGEIAKLLDVAQPDSLALLPRRLESLFDRMRELGFTRAMVDAVGSQMVFQGMELAVRYEVSLEEMSGRYPQGALYALDQARGMDEYRQVLLTLFSYLLAAVQDKRAHAGSAKLAQRAVRFLQENYTDTQLSAGELAEHFSVSAAHISRVFKENMGVTLQAYLTGLRVGHAKRLLTAQRDLPLSVVAERSGYASLTTFMRAFKKETGFSPGSYRQEGGRLDQLDGTAGFKENGEEQK